METILRGNGTEVVVGREGTTIIGEKINPTGNSKLADALTRGELDLIRDLANRQIEWGADVLDVNTGVPGLDEPAVLVEAIKIVTSATNVPLCLDSANPKALEAGLAVTPGKPLVNSVNGEEKSLSWVLPMIGAQP
jgi:5-methyltetrahydrofolate--homocysteine methyltransferase